MGGAHQIFRPINGQPPAVLAFKRAMQARDKALQELRQQKSALVRMLVAVAQSPDAVEPTEHGFCITTEAFQAVKPTTRINLHRSATHVELQIAEDLKAEPAAEPSRIVIPGRS